MKNFVLATATVALLTGCVTAKEWTAMGGSRADGTVRLSYEVWEMELPRVDEAQGIEVATRHCRSWGYNGAEPFRGTTRECSHVNGSGSCSFWIVSKDYQCIGTGTPGAAPAAGRR